jgi:hypothetical protein
MKNVRLFRNTNPETKATHILAIRTQSIESMPSAVAAFISLDGQQLSTSCGYNALGLRKYRVLPLEMSDDDALRILAIGRAIFPDDERDVTDPYLEEMF